MLNRIRKIFTPNLKRKIPFNSYQKFKINDVYPPGIQGDRHIKWIEKNVKEFAKIIKTKTEPKVILDIGSLNGIESIFLSEFFPNAKIFTFEPNPESFKIVKFLTNNYQNIKVFNLAASNKNKKNKFYITPNLGTCSILEPIGGPAGNEFEIIEVLHERIDSFALKHNIKVIDAIWMDVQGSESLVLEGMGKLLNTVKVLKTELGKKSYYKEQTLSNEILSYLKDFKTIKKSYENEWEEDRIFIRN